MCLVSYTFCMIPHVLTVTFGLNVYGPGVERHEKSPKKVISRTAICGSSGELLICKVSQFPGEEALSVSDLVSDLFKLNKLSALHLLLHGKEQLPQCLGITSGLVAANLYYDDRKRPRRRSPTS